MVARNEDNLALEDVLEVSKYLSKLMQFLFFVMGVTDMVAVHDITAHQTVIKMKRVTLHMRGQLLEIISIIVDIAEEN